MDSLEVRYDALVDSYNSLRASQKNLLRSLGDTQNDIVRLKQDTEDCVLAVQLVTSFIDQLNQDMLAEVSRLVTGGLKHVFGETYTFRCTSRILRNQVELEMYVGKEGIERDVKSACYSGGVADVVSLLLRILVWAFTHDKGRPLFILDEPGRNIDNEKQSMFGQFLKTLSHDMSLQIIVVSHFQCVAQFGDLGYTVSRPGKYSLIEKVQE